MKKFGKIINIVIKSALVVAGLIYVQSSENVFKTNVTNENVNKIVNLSTMALKIEEIEANSLYSSKDTYTGNLTGYVFNCPKCGGKLACKPKYDITDGKDYYDDDSYGRVKIVASSSNLACGSIVRFSSSRISDEPVIAIVLDRGVRGNALDLLSPDLHYATHNIGRISITYDVLRQGWE